MIDTTSVFPFPIDYSRLGRSTNTYLDCSNHAEAQEFLRVEEQEGIEDIFDEKLILILADYQSAIEGWNIFVKKIVALVMGTLFLPIFIRQKENLFLLQ